MTEHINTYPAPRSFVFDQEMAKRLVAQLSRARDIYDGTPSIFDTTPPADESAVNWRSSATIALQATMTFLSAGGVDSSLLAPFKSLSYALSDIADGRSNGMLERVDKGHNRSHQPFEHEYRVAEAVAYIEFALRADGRGGLKIATKTMARLMGISPTTMAEKRKNILKRRSVSENAYLYYEFLVQRKNELCPAMLRFYMEHTLSLVRNSKSPPRKSSRG